MASRQPPRASPRSRSRSTSCARRASRCTRRRSPSACSPPAAPRLKGKTPEATISAMLAVGSKPGGPFTRVDKGTYTLADTAARAAEAGPGAKPKSQPTRKRQAAKPAQ